MAWVSWQVGNYQSGRSKNHMSRDDISTLCGKKIPARSRKFEVFLGYEGEGECKGCQRVLDREAKEYAEYVEKYALLTYLESKSDWRETLPWNKKS